MAIYHLECILRYEDGRPDTETENHTIEALTLPDAIALADLHGCTKPLMVMVSAKLFGPLGEVVWSRRTAWLPFESRASDFN